jgi:radical SAM superfamily enzyme YgiQ (UPF0313 family)
MTRVVLLRTATSRLRLFKWYWLLASREPPLGLLYIATHLSRAGHDVTILDGERIGNRALLRRLLELDPDLVGITATTFSFFEAVDLLGRVREQHPRARLVMGGPHVTALPGDALARAPMLDACIVGEGERPMVALAAGTPLAEVSGVAWRDHLGVRTNPAAPALDTLDELGLDWDLLDGFPDGYRPSLQSARGTRPISLMASRGCPFPCSFCAGPIALGKKRRAHSPARVVAMMRELYDRFGTTHTYFHDDHFTLDRPWLDEFIDRCAAEPAPLAWSCASRVEVLDKALLARMQCAGCYQIGVGGESGSTEVLKRLDKRLTVTRLEAGIRRIRDAGIATKLYVMIGTPGERPADVLRTLELVGRLQVDHVQVLYFTPLPGTSSWATTPMPPEHWHRMNLLNPMPGTTLSTPRLRAAELLLYAQTYGGTGGGALARRLGARLFAGGPS